MWICRACESYFLLPKVLSALPQAFSWWPELMAEHAETFLSLYRADMDAALHVQPVDSWDSFPLFQLHNNFLRMDRKCHCPTEKR